MALTAHPIPSKAKSVDICNVFIAGAPKDASGHVFFGIKDENFAAWRAVLKAREDFYFIDNSYFDAVRGGSDIHGDVQFRVTKNAVQMPAERVRAAKTTGDRFENLGLEIAPWVGERGGFILVVEQSPLFMRTTANYPTWMQETLNELSREPWPVKVRPWNPDKVKIQRTLPEDLLAARMVVTHSSAAAITGALAGVPFRVSPMSAIHGMQPEERYHFFRVLADGQFTIREMRDGLAWRMVQ
jgi:hypothetical protein